MNKSKQQSCPLVIVVPDYVDVVPDISVQNGFVALPQQSSSIPASYGMLTMSKTGHSKPKLFSYSITASPEPRNVKEALNNPHWLAAMQDEYNALMKNKTWS